MQRSVRHRYHRHARKLLGLPSTTGHFLQDGDDDTPADRGDMILNSFYAPALDADAMYSITTQQTATIDPPGGGPSYSPDPLQNADPQQFHVFAPQWTLEASDVHSVYPAPAQEEYPQILPHVVFNGPHLPWERGARYSDKILDPQRNRVPWLAVLVFDGDAELKLSATELGSTTDAGLFPPGVTPKQDGISYAVGMTWTQLNSMQTVSKQVNLAAPPDDPDVALNVIFPRTDLYAALFAPAAGQPTNLEKYKYFAHYRNINTAGMADAGVADTGFYSIVISSRTGPTNVQSPHNVVVHVVSLDGIPEYATFDPAQGRASLVSLYSWTYRCLPPQAISFVDTMENLSKQSNQILRAPPMPSMPAAMQARVAMGYSLIRYRVLTGEQTVAFMRGPLVPVPSDGSNFVNWPAHSSTSTAYQILDPETGIMDVSYSVAWQLGRTLAIADQSFATALSRYRTACFNMAWARTKEKIMREQGLWRSKDDLMIALHRRIDHLGQLPHSGLRDSQPNLRQRWNRQEPFICPSFSLKDQRVRNIYTQELQGVMKTLCAGTDSQEFTATEAEPAPYNEFNFPTSNDWPTIQAWIMDKKFLHNVPAHYLITDPAQVPMESLRLFYIDKVWVDCLIDGALSIANHLDAEDDAIRQGIKDRIHNYITTPLNAKQPFYYPQIPTTGFLVRSAVVKVLPDLQITAPYPKASPAGQNLDILRQERIDESTMFCLMDRGFDSDHLQNITFSQPPHQQCFAFGADLDATKVEFLFRRVYNNPANPPSPDADWGDLLSADPSASNPAYICKRGDANAVYDWTHNLVLIDQLVKVMLDQLTKFMGDSFLPAANSQPAGLGSATVALMLNEPIYQMVLLAGSKSNARFASRRGFRAKLPLQPDSSDSRLRLSSTTVKLPPAEKIPKVRAPANLKIIPVRPSRKKLAATKLPPPPHIRPMLSHFEPAEPRAVTAGTNKFHFSAYPSKALLTRNFETPIPADTPIPVDMVFSLKLDKSAPSEGFMLRAIVVYMPMGNQPPPQPNPAPRVPYVNMMSAYTGTGPRMLANPRWLVSVAPTKAPSPGSKKLTAYLACTLLPRTTKLSVALRDNQDCSFILNMIPVDPAVGQVEVWGEEIYWYTPPGGGPGDVRPYQSPFKTFITKAKGS
ncbi:hypothetical protein LTR10_012587 [Elasticomyces elasticus]|nr:hypothetical protein LTR10_012587 [Elasticomyces elasticus]KAK5043362.1 hypothetical protein LTR13_001133 [Exophiala sideris]